MRTTSSLESNNAVLNKSLPKRSNFFKFTQSLKQQEFAKSTDFLNICNGLQAKNVRTKKNHTEKNNQINKLKYQFDAKVISLNVYIKSLAEIKISNNSF